MLWHGWTIARLIRATLPSRFRAITRFYVAAACLLPVGATLGVILARGLADPWHTRLMVAHAAINLLGWVGLTVTGTLVTLWPTMLRTRIAEGAERASARALPVLALAVVGTATAAILGSRSGVAVGLVAYIGGLALTAPAFVDAARRKPPVTFPAWSVLAGIGWLLGCLAVLAVGIGAAQSWAEVSERFGWLTPYLAAGFAAQVLLGALSYLMPVALGGGARPTRAANAAFDSGGPFRVAAVNAGLLVCVLPVPSVVRVLASMLVLGAMVSWLPLMILAIRASRRTKREIARTIGEAPIGPDGTSQVRPDPAPHGQPARPRGQAAGLATTGLVAVALVVALGVAYDPAAVGAGATSAAAGIAATGEVTTVEVTARDMRYHPASITVPAGNRLVIEFTNSDEGEVHDLVLDSGDRTGRLSPGQSARLDVGVVGRGIDGWCSVFGHRQMGMVLAIVVEGGTGGLTEGGGDSDTDTGHDHGDHAHGPSAGSSGSDSGHTSSDNGEAPSAADGLDFMAAPPDGFQAYHPLLPPLPSQGDSRIHRHTFTVGEVEREVAPGVTQKLWTYNGTAPGPTLHGRVGDTFEITLVNDGTIGHSIDFHAGALAPDGPMRTIAPGESLVYRFKATRAGIWMYHCSTMPMAAHIANGLFGAVIIEPPDLPEVDRSYVMVQSELYLGEQGGEVDFDKLYAERPDAVVFNGYVNQYDHQPLAAKVGERIRVWVLDVGPNRPSSFHVIGAQFDTTFAEGAYLLDPTQPRARATQGGAQALGLQAAQGGFVELSFPEAGTYPFVSHLMVDAERGAHGKFRVTD